VNDERLGHNWVSQEEHGRKRVFVNDETYASKREFATDEF